MHLAVKLKKQWSVILHLPAIANIWAQQFTLSDFAILFLCTCPRVPIRFSGVGVLDQQKMCPKVAERLSAKNLETKEEARRNIRARLGIKSKVQ